MSNTINTIHELKQDQPEIMDASSMRRQIYDRSGFIKVTSGYLMKENRGLLLQAGLTEDGRLEDLQRVSGEYSVLTLQFDGSGASGWDYAWKVTKATHGQGRTESVICLNKDQAYVQQTDFDSQGREKFTSDSGDESVVLDELDYVLGSDLFEATMNEHAQKRERALSRHAKYVLDITFRDYAPGLKDDLIEKSQFGVEASGISHTPVIAPKI